MDRNSGSRSGSNSRSVSFESYFRPWWYEALPILQTAVRVCLFPVFFICQMAELAVSLAVIAVITVCALWYLGYIPDHKIVEVLKPVGMRLLAIIQSSSTQQ